MKTYIVGLGIAHYTAIIIGGMFIGGMLTLGYAPFDMVIGVVLAVLVAIVTATTIVKELEERMNDE